MKLIALLQDSDAYDAGYNIGYMIGKYLPLVVVIIVAYLIFRYFQKKSKK